MGYSGWSAELYGYRMNRWGGGGGVWGGGGMHSVERSGLNTWSSPLK